MLLIAGIIIFLSVVCFYSQSSSVKEGIIFKFTTAKNRKLLRVLGVALVLGSVLMLTRVYDITIAIIIGFGLWIGLASFFVLFAPLFKVKSP